MDGDFCFDPADPCEGFYCGGGDRGSCVPDPATLRPTCLCTPGFNNDAYALYCCPDGQTAEVCAGLSGDTGGDDAPGASSSGP